MRLKKIIYVVITLIMMGFIALYLVAKPNYIYYKTEKIPNSDIQVAIYIQSNFKTIAMSGESDYKKVYLHLQDLNGNTLSKPNLFNKCTVQKGNVYLKVIDNKLYFTKFSYIDLIDYSYYCFGNGM